MPAVEVSGLTVRYGPLTAVDGAGFTADAGKVTALLGPNGAGKTTTLETLEGYRRPDAGHVRVLGLDPLRQQAQVAERTGVLLQEGGVHPGIRPGEALRLFAAFYAEPLDPDALLARVGLDHRRRSTWRQLSGGEQRRLGLALALVGRPEVAFLDEPTAGLDVDGRRLVREVVGGLRDDGCCVVLATHELDEAQRLADRVVIVDHGRVVADGSLRDLAELAGPAQLRFAAPTGLDVTAMQSSLGFTVSEVEPGEYVGDADPSPATVAALTGWLAERDIPLGDLRAGRQRLEDVFDRLTGKAAE